VYSKAQLFNLALNALLLQRRIINPDTDQSNEAKVLNTNFDVAFRATLQDLNLDSLSSQVKLELLCKNPNKLWAFAYKYPSNCAFFRRIQSDVLMDNRDTFIAKRVAIHNGQKVIFTNQEEAIAEFIPFDVPLSALSAVAGLCVATRLAILSSPLVTGKGSRDLLPRLEQQYVLLKAEAQRQDQLENYNYVPDHIQSEWYNARIK